MIILIAAFAISLVILVVRGVTVRRWERDVARRLPVGENGIIPGAEPFELRGESTASVLLLHGFGDTPQTLRYLAEALRSAGYTVRVPLLPGHGRTLGAFRRSTADDWLASARAEYQALRARFPAVGLAGLSMGGALATVIASEQDVPAMALLAPFLTLKPDDVRAARAARWWRLVMPYARNRGGGLSILDDAERAQNRAYGVVSGDAVYQLTRLVDRAWSSLPAVRTPTLVIQSRNDQRISVAGCEASFARLGATDKRLVLTDVGGHIITVDVGRDVVMRAVAEWLTSHVPPAPLTSEARAFA